AGAVVGGLLGIFDVLVDHRLAVSGPFGLKNRSSHRVGHGCPPLARAGEGGGPPPASSPVLLAAGVQLHLDSLPALAPDVQALFLQGGHGRFRQVGPVHVVTYLDPFQVGNLGGGDLDRLVPQTVVHHTDAVGGGPD